MSRVQIKLRPDAIVPRYMTAHAAGLDLSAAIDAPITIAPRERVAISTGLAFALEPGYEGQIRPRSGLAREHGITLVNTPGTIDADYRGPVTVLVINHGADAVTIRPGDRIAQIVIAPVEQAELVEVEELGTTERGSGGFRIHRQMSERPKSGTLPGAPPPRPNTPAPPGIPVVAPYSVPAPTAVPVRATTGAERSEPIRVISMKEHSEPVRMPERPPPQVKLRAIADLAKPPKPAPQGRLAPRDGREARARQQRKNVLWVLGGLVLAVAIAATVWFVAGR